MAINVTQIEVMCVNIHMYYRINKYKYRTMYIIEFYLKLLVILFRNCISLTFDVLLYYDCKLQNYMQWLLLQNYFDNNQNIFNISLIDLNNIHNFFLSVL